VLWSRLIHITLTLVSFEQYIEHLKTSNIQYTLPAFQALADGGGY